MAIRVVKLGGSLLDMPDMVPRLRAWLARQTPADTLLVVGGGALADAIRAAHRLHRLPDGVAHWLCVRAMTIQAEMMLALLSEGVWHASVADFQPSTARLGILDPWHFLREDEPRLAARPLPESWDVTSDSIAARAAEVTKAAELVLLKSAPPEHLTIAEMAEAGYVDRFFPQATTAIARVRFVNLRDESCAEAVITSSHHPR